MEHYENNLTALMCTQSLGLRHCSMRTGIALATSERKQLPFARSNLRKFWLGAIEYY